MPENEVSSNYSMNQSKQYQAMHFNWHNHSRHHLANSSDRQGKKGLQSTNTCCSNSKF